MAVYPKGTSNIINSPDWVSKEDDAETVALAYFNAFKSVTFTVNGTSITSALDITSAAGSGRGNIANHERNGEYLGDKLYEILNPSEMSYKVTYDFINNQKVLTVWQGIDRREEQTDNNPIVFSTKYGNIKNPNILIDNTKYKKYSHSAKINPRLTMWMSYMREPYRKERKAKQVMTIRCYLLQPQSIRQII